LVSAYTDASDGCFVSGDRAQLLAVRAARVPLAALELLARPLGRGDRLVRALAVDAHARGDDHLADRVLEQRLQQHAGACRVRRGVLGGLIHALADADPGAEVADGIDALERSAHDLAVTEVAGDQLDLVCEVGGALLLAAVHLLHEAVEGPHAVAGPHELVAQVRADEARSAGDQNRLRHGAKCVSRRTSPMLAAKPRTASGGERSQRGPSAIAQKIGKANRLCRAKLWIVPESSSTTVTVVANAAHGR
jgi:hypothetical protein